jgi:hypothetical protein
VNSPEESEGHTESEDREQPTPPVNQPDTAVDTRPPGSGEGGKLEETEWQKRHIRIQAAIAFVGAIAVIIYGFQLCEMRKSTNAATDAAKAAKDGITFARDNAHLDQRAWVTISASQLVSPLVVGERPVIVVTLVNSGKTPALNVVSSGDADTVARGFSESEINSSLGTGHPGSKFVIGPGVTAKTMCNGLRLIADETEIDDLHAASSEKGPRLYVRGVIAYDDIFGKPHRTTFCAWINGRDLEGPTMHSCEFGNTAD